MCQSIKSPSFDYLFLALPAESVEQQFDTLDVLRVDSQVQRVAAHVVDAVDVDAVSWLLLMLQVGAGRGLLRLPVIGAVEDLAHQAVVANTSRVQVQTLLGRQLARTYTPTQPAVSDVCLRSP